jgi:acetyl esterase/lipase
MNAKANAPTHLNRWKNFLIAAFAFIGHLAPSHSEQPAEPKLIPYKTTSDARKEPVKLHLHVFTPNDNLGKNNRPAIVFFFGGGWMGGTPSQFYPQCRHLAQRGMVAISAEYRTAKPHGTTPAECVKDGKSALRYVRSNAKSLGIDPLRVAAGGGSAGGHVAAAIATLEGFNDPDDDSTVSAKPDALVLFNPVFDNGPTGYGHDRVKAYWESFSPLHNLSAQTPPAIVFLGTKDNLIPTATAEAFRDKMKKLGVRSELFLYEGQPHGFFNAKNAEHYEKTLAEADRFLTSLGFLSPHNPETK